MKLADNFCVTHDVRMNGNDYPRCTLGLENGEACEMRPASQCHQELNVSYGHPEWGTCVCGAIWPCLAAFSADDLAGHCDDVEVPCIDPAQCGAECRGICFNRVTNDPEDVI